MCKSHLGGQSFSPCRSLAEPVAVKPALPGSETEARSTPHPVGRLRACDSLDRVRSKAVPSRSNPKAPAKNEQNEERIVQIRSPATRSMLGVRTTPFVWLAMAILLFARIAVGEEPGSSVDPAPGERATAESKPQRQPAIASATKAAAQAAVAPVATLDPSARLLEGDDASEHWTLYIELESGHRIAQRFLLTNAGPGDHNAVALGHLIEPGRAPYEYVNGRRRSSWTLSDDRLFFEFDAKGLSARVPSDRLPKGYEMDVLAVAAPTHGTLRAPWMSKPLETRGRTWLVHTRARSEESSLVDRRIELYGQAGKTFFYAFQLDRGSDFSRSWALFGGRDDKNIESTINIIATDASGSGGLESPTGDTYPLPRPIDFSGERYSGRISLTREWLRFDPLAVIPQPIQWFIRRNTNPREVWADARIGVRISSAPEAPSLPLPGEAESDFNSNRETESETAERSVTGVASITFLNPTKRR